MTIQNSDTSNTFTVFAVPVWEYERGWGSKIDDYMICLSEEIANAFIKEFNSRNNLPTVPDWYMTAEDKIEARPVSEKHWDILVESAGKCWNSYLITQ